MDRVQMKLKAKSQISGKLGILFLCYFIIMVIGGLIAALTSSSTTMKVIGSIASILILSPITIGFSGIYLGVARDVYPEVKNLFKYIKYYFKAIGLSLLVGLIILAGYIFIVPGIILSFALSQVNYIFADNPDMKITDIISTSMSMMKGHKWEFFVLQLSFLGWVILGVFTLNILTIVYVTPYQMTTTANFYLGIKDEYMGKMSNEAVLPSSPSPEDSGTNNEPWEIK